MNKSHTRRNKLDAIQALLEEQWQAGEKQKNVSEHKVEHQTYRIRVNQGFDNLRFMKSSQAISIFVQLKSWQHQSMCHFVTGHSTLCQCWSWIDANFGNLHKTIHYSYTTCTAIHQRTVRCKQCWRDRSSQFESRWEQKKHSKFRLRLNVGNCERNYSNWWSCSRGLM